MFQSTTASALVAGAFLLPSVFAGVINKRVNPNENVLLTYCRDNSNNVINGQMAYFSGTPDGNPSATTIVSGSNGGVVTWEQNSPNTGTFSDQNYFTSLIRFQPDDGTYAGLGQNKEGGFSCYRHQTNSAYYYTDSAGLTCTEEYICNHVTPSTVPVFTNFSPSSSTNTLENTIQWTAGHVISLAKNTFSNGICTPGNSQTIDDTGCSVTFTCNADSNTVLQSMTDFLVNNVAQAPGSNFQTMSIKDNGISPPCQSQDGCPTPPPEYQYYLTMPSQMNVDLNYIETVEFPQGIKAADFGYSISCAAQSCFACQTLEAFLTGAALVPDLSLIAGIANIGATAACQHAANCS